MRNISQQFFPACFSKFIGIPYEVKNCWDIVVDFYDEVLGISLFNYYSGPAPKRDTTKGLIYSNMGDFEKVDTPQFGDIVILKVFGIESHIGVYIDKNKFLHSTEKSGCVLDRLDRWNKLIVGFYRVKT